MFPWRIHKHIITHSYSPRRTLLLVRGIAVVVGGSRRDNSATRLCIQACCAAVKPDCSSIAIAPDEDEAPGEVEIDVIEVDVAAELAIGRRR